MATNAHVSQLVNLSACLSTCQDACCQLASKFDKRQRVCLNYDGARKYSRCKYLQEN